MVDLLKASLKYAEMLKLQCNLFIYYFCNFRAFCDVIISGHNIHVFFYIILVLIFYFITDISDILPRVYVQRNINIVIEISFWGEWVVYWNSQAVNWLGNLSARVLSCERYYSYSSWAISSEIKVKYVYWTSMQTCKKKKEKQIWTPSLYTKVIAHWLYLKYWIYSITH
jgi:hypothetical protein